MLKNEGAKSDLVFIQTKESGKLRRGQHYGNLQKNTPVAHQNVLSTYLFWQQWSYQQCNIFKQTDQNLFDILTF